MKSVLGAVGFVLLAVVPRFGVLAQTPAPSLQLTDLQGRNFRISDYRGSVLLINFWATWCAPCRTEVPELVKWQRQYGTQGLQVIGITYPPQTRLEVRRFARKTRINYPVILGTKATKTLFTSSEALPVTVIVDRQGNVHDSIEGIVFPDEFDAKIRPLLVNTAQSVSVNKPKRPRVQKAIIRVNAEGYQPVRINLRRGVPARLTFIRKVTEGCGAEIVIPAYKINRPLPLNVPVTVSFTPTKSGRFKLTCGMDMFRGWLVVK